MWKSSRSKDLDIREDLEYETEVKPMIGTRAPVLDKGWIELQDLMGDDNAIVAAAWDVVPRR